MGRITKSLITSKSYPFQASTKFSFGSQSPQKQTKEVFLKNYNDVAWLRSAVSLIAQSIALSKWKLYRNLKGGDREEITAPHELKTLINRPNPYQSGHDFFELHQTFDELIGENYWVKVKDKGNLELWLAPPQYMNIVPGDDSKTYIKGYKYTRGTFTRDFKPEEIISFMTPNPADMFTGSGRAQSIDVDIQNEIFTGQYIRNFFYWGADPGTIIVYPPEANISPDELDRLNEQWSAGHRSYGRAHRAAILTQGATVTKEGTSLKDMEFVNLREYDRKAILAVFGVSYSMVGGTETVNRANAEAQLLNFARWVVTPRLVRIREKMNMFLCPDFGEDLEVDFENPVPEDEAQQAGIIDNHVKTGIMSLEEARQTIDLGEIEPEHHFYIPFSTTIKTGQEILEPEPKPTPPPQLTPFNKPPQAPESITEPPEAQSGTELPKKSISDPKVDKWAEDFWKAYVKQAENYEPQAKTSLRKMFKGQESEAQANLKNAIDSRHQFIDKRKALKDYDKAMKPILTDVILNAVKSGKELIEPENPHKQDGLPNQNAIDWLLTRMGWAAEQTTEQTASMLSESLAEGYANGESIDQLSTRVQEVFTNCSDVRAERIARTEILQASAYGTIEGYKVAGVEKTRFYPALDGACEDCITVSETDQFGFGPGIFPVSESQGIITVHPSCRCVWLPVVD